MTSILVTPLAAGETRATENRRHTVAVAGTDVVFSCASGETIIHAFEKTGLDTIFFGCRRGGCGLCKVQLLDGAVRIGVMSARHVNATDVDHGIVLACCTYPDSDVTLTPVNTSQNSNAQEV